MSLRAFHLFFIAVAAAFCFAFAAWALVSREVVSGAMGYCALGAAGGVALAVWARRAARALREPA